MCHRGILEQHSAAQNTVAARLIYDSQPSGARALDGWNPEKATTLTTTTHFKRDISKFVIQEFPRPQPKTHSFIDNDDDARFLSGIPSFPVSPRAPVAHQINYFVTLAAKLIIREVFCSHVQCSISLQAHRLAGTSISETREILGHDSVTAASTRCNRRRRAIYSWMDDGMERLNYVGIYDF